MRVRWLGSTAAALALLLLATGCTSPDTSVAAKTTPTPSPTATETPDIAPSAEPEPTEEEEGAPLFSQRGLLPVGVTTIPVGDRFAEVWYPGDPARVGDRETDVFDTSDLFPEELADLIPEAVSASIDTGAYRDLPAAPGPFPVVVFSHGAPSFRQQSTRLTTHLASWGFVVVSVDHLERGLEAFLDDLVEPDATPSDETEPDATPSDEAEPDATPSDEAESDATPSDETEPEPTPTQAAAAAESAPETQPRDEFDVQNALIQLEAANETPGSLLEGVIDLQHLAVSGQSAGSTTAWRLAELADVDAVIALNTFEPLQVDTDVEGIERLTAVGVPPGEYQIEFVEVGPEEVTLALDGESQVQPVDAISLTPDAGGDIEIEVDPATLTVGRVNLTIRLGAKPSLVISSAADVVTPPERAEAVFDLAAAPRILISIAEAGHDSFSDACAILRDAGGLEAALGPLADALGDLAVAGDNGCTPESVDPLLAQDVAAHYMVAHLYDVLELADVTGALDPGMVDLIEGVELDDYQSVDE